MARRARNSTFSPPTASEVPDWIAPQLSRLVEMPPDGSEWAHEVKFDGYRMHARIAGRSIRLLTRTGLDWTEKFPSTAQALRSLGVRSAYLDGELCGISEAGVTSFSSTHAAQGNENGHGLVYFAFDLLHVGSQDLRSSTFLERKERLAAMLSKPTLAAAIRYSEHQVGGGLNFHHRACELKLEGVVSKRVDAAYVPGNRGLWVKSKCLNREEFVVVGWTDPEGSRQHLGALLLGYYEPDGRLAYAGRVGTGMTARQLASLRDALQPLVTDKMPLDVAPPRTTRFGSRSALSRVRWVKPEMVIEVSFLGWTDDNLLRHVVFEGVRHDKPASDVRRPVPM
ncbi:MAG TPA: non-homologous end-joining DNA ligase [Acidimicrobiales bacterium]